MSTSTAANPSVIPLDNRPLVRTALGFAATTLMALVAYGSVRWLAGLAPPTPWVRGTALATHLITVIPAIPIGAYLLLTRKGGPRHRLLGKSWLGLMFVSATATLFIRNVNAGQLSWIHVFTLVTFVTIPRAYLSARRRQFDRHRNITVSFYAGALIAAGFTAFFPGRTMWQWAFGDPAVSQASHS